MRIQANIPVTSAGNTSNEHQAARQNKIGAKPIAAVVVFGEIVNSLKDMNEKLQVYNSRAEFSIHEKTGDVMVRILDINTNEVIREIPPKKIKDMVANILERAGLLVDSRA